TGFLAAVVQLLDPSGELVSITPRSCCNGPYFRTFRQSLLKTINLRHLHVFESRVVAFRDDDVLQENVILHAVKQPATPGKVMITSSAGPDDESASMREM